MMQTQTHNSEPEAARWQAVLGRDRSRDGAFVYAVSSTGIYCRPSCPSRRPRRERVTFFDLPEAAEQAGYRPCQRCTPRRIAAADPRLERIRRACRFIEAHEGVATLDELGAHVGLSPFHLQRTFKQVLGITPRQYGDATRLGRVRALLRAGDDVSGAIYEAGYGSSSRLYERAPSQLGMTPATYRKGGAGAHIAYALADCALGRLMVAATETGICFVALGSADTKLVTELKEEFPAADIAPGNGALAGLVRGVLAHVDGAAPGADLPLDVRATAFQWRVWQELRDIPKGQTLTYKDIAERIGRPKAARAVGRACATNPVSLVVPCHRAVRGDGGLGGYRWGLERKQALLDHERATAARRRG